MENASKALIMAGGILIAILILSVGIYLYVSVSKAPISYEESLILTETQKFNSNFTKFEGRTDIRVQEIVTLINFVREYNSKSGEQIKVYVRTENCVQKENLISFIENNSTKKYKINQTKEMKYNNEGKIIEIYFVEI